MDKFAHLRSIYGRVKRTKRATKQVKNLQTYALIAQQEALRIVKFELLSMRPILEGNEAIRMKDKTSMVNAYIY
jgi:hypothetical protein